MKPQLTEHETLLAEAIFSGEAARKWLALWLKNQAPLIEPFCIALAFHVLFIPVIWVAGWLLPWPKSPIITTIIEYDLRNWPRESKPKKVIDIRDPELNR